LTGWRFSAILAFLQGGFLPLGFPPGFLGFIKETTLVLHSSLFCGPVGDADSVVTRLAVFFALFLCSLLNDEMEWEFDHWLLLKLRWMVLPGCFPLIACLIWLFCATDHCLICLISAVLRLLSC
jgi:hypothetical protein